MSKGALEALKCPQCGGDVELDENQEYGFCKYCGTKVQNTNFKIIKGKIELVGNPTVDNYIKLAARYFDDGEYTEALDYYNKVLEIEPDNWKAIFRRGAILNIEDNFNQNQIISSSNNALKIISNNKKLLEDVNNIELEIVYDMIKILSDAYKRKTYSKIDNIIDILNYIEALIQQVEERTKSDTNDKYEEKLKKALKDNYNNTILFCYEIIRNKPIEEFSKYRKIYSDTADKIKEIDDKYKLPIEAYKVVKIIREKDNSDITVKIDESQLYHLQTQLSNLVYEINVYDINTKRKEYDTISAKVVDFWLPKGTHNIIIDGEHQYEVDLINNDIVELEMVYKYVTIREKNFDGIVKTSKIENNVIEDSKDTDVNSNSSTYAIIAFVLSFFGGIIPLTGIISIILAIISLSRKERKKGLSIAALIIDGLVLLVFIALLICNF